MGADFVGVRCFAPCKVHREAKGPKSGMLNTLGVTENVFRFMVVVLSVKPTSSSALLERS